MNTAITLILILSPCVLSLPQFQEDTYRRQLEEQETPQLYEKPSQFQRETSSHFQRRVPVARERSTRPFARIQKVTVPQPLPTAAPQPERYEPQLITRQEEVYSRPQPQPQLISRQDEAYSRPQAQVPLFTQPQLQQTAAPAAPQAQEEEYNIPLLRVQSIQAAAAASQEDRYKSVDNRYSTPIPIIKYDKSQSLDGSYKTSYETGNNIIAEESGFIKNIGVKDQEALVQQGTYSYTAPDGTVITTSYTADEGGFRVEGSHIPTPPPIPEEIRKSLETIYEGIRQQQEAEARDAKYGKTRPGSAEETNSISDNYPQNYPTFA